MGRWEDYKPVMAMFVMQFIYAALALTTRSALVQGMSPRVFVVYRQAIATLVMAPIAYFFEGRKSSTSSLGLRSFSLIFLAALIGVTINQNIYFEGLYLASSSMASAMGNLVPGITFLVATFVGFEKVDMRRLSSIAKIAGTILCVSGAVCMAFARGPKLLNSEFTHQHLQQQNSIILHYYSSSAASAVSGEHWILGCFLLFGSCCCWSLWLILQVPMTACYPNQLCISAWMCFFGTLQSGAVTLFLEPDSNAWRLHSKFEILCAIYAGIIGSAFSFFVQGWSISLRGPLFTSMFSPLCTVIVTFMACIFLHEELYAGSLAGAIAVVAGLYVVLWGKAKDMEKIAIPIDDDENDSKKTVKILIQDSSDKEISRSKIDLEEPLLTKI